jgi:hypothetical protein
MKKKGFGKNGDEPENGVLAFYKEKKKWIPYPAKEAPKIEQFGRNHMLHNATDWIVDEVMHNDREEGVKLEFWAYNDGNEKHTLIFLEGCVTEEKEGSWVDVKLRMPWLVI